MARELSVITVTYDLLVWTLRHTAKFPRSHRHGLARRIEAKLHDLLDGLVEAKFTHEKAEMLRQAALRVEELRLLYRVSKDLHLLALRSHEYANRQLQDIGRQLGGWRRKMADSR